MKYSESYLTNHDIDWFGIVNGVYIHVASAGGDIPSQVNDIERLKDIHRQISFLPDIYTNEAIEYNESGIANILSQDSIGLMERSQYIESFTAMARKGFVSFDRTNIGDPNDNRYHLVCKPKDNKRKPQLDGLNTVKTNSKFEDWKEDLWSIWINS